MHLLYFFRQWGPRVTHETVQGGPSQMEGGAAFFFDHPCSFGCQNQLCCACAAHYYPTLLPVLSSIKSPHPPCLRPYHLEHTSSRPITEVKQG